VKTATVKISRQAWGVAALLFLATLLNYLDRLTLSVVSRDVRQSFGLNEIDYSHVTTLFLAAYAIMYAGSGFLIDRVGTKKGFALFMLTWSVAQFLHGFAVGKWSLGACRFLLGLAEPGNWPASAKAVAEWFPVERRALGIGIFNAGSSLGSAIAPPLVSYLALTYGWRSAFLVTGSLGIVWLVGWLWFYYTPESAKAAQKVEEPRRPWRQIFATRGCWTLCLARFFTDPVIYFVIFWLPEYLGKERGFDLALIGKVAWIPFLFGDVGYITGGWLSGKLMDRGMSLGAARRRVMYLGAAIMPVAILAPRVPEAWMAIAAMSVMTMGHAMWVANLQSIPADVFRQSEVGTASGLTGMGGAVGGMLANLGTGYVAQNFGYTPIFLVAGLMHPLAAVLVSKLLGPREIR
jgi:MFS transporter, ACS family, hexuronate transporter